MQATMTNANARRTRQKSKGGIGRAIKYLTHYRRQAAFPIFSSLSLLSRNWQCPI